MPILIAHFSIVRKTDQSTFSFAGDDVTVIGRPLYGPMTRLAPHLNRSASSSEIAPFAFSGTQLAH